LLDDLLSVGLVLAEVLLVLLSVVVSLLSAG
jgi:hypothetical protein